MSMVEIESARTKAGDARIVTAGPLPTTARIAAPDIAPSRSTSRQDSSKVGTDISP
jgi:hypothetical protein